MTPILRAELRKLRLTRSLWLLLLAGVAISVVAGTVLVTSFPESELGRRLSEHGPLRFGPSNIGLLLVIFGIRLWGDETHHGTLASTFVDLPARGRVLAAKAVVAVGAAVGVTAAIYALVVPVTVIAVDQRGFGMTMDAGATAALFGRVTAAMALSTLLGLVVATIVRNRTAALVGAAVWIMLAEQLIGSILEAPELLPTAAVSGLVSDGGAGYLAAPSAGLLLAATTAALGIGALASLRRDVA